MKKREARIYYIPEKEGKKAMLVFDAGYIDGDVHIYEHVKLIQLKKLSKKLTNIYTLISCLKQFWNRRSNMVRKEIWSFDVIKVNAIIRLYDFQ